MKEEENETGVLDVRGGHANDVYREKRSDLDDHRDTSPYSACQACNSSVFCLRVHKKAILKSDANQALS